MSTSPYVLPLSVTFCRHSNAAIKSTNTAVRCDRRIPKIFLLKRYELLESRLGFSLFLFPDAGAQVSEGQAFKDADGQGIL